MKTCSDQFVWGQCTRMTSIHQTKLMVLLVRKHSVDLIAVYLLFRIHNLDFMREAVWNVWSCAGNYCKSSIHNLPLNCYMIELTFHVRHQVFIQQFNCIGRFGSLWGRRWIWGCPTLPTARRAKRSRGGIVHWSIVWIEIKKWSCETSWVQYLTRLLIK